MDERGKKSMSEELFSHTQRFQQAIATTITCRSIIKYNSTLNSEQKAEILADIEHTLAFLETRLAANAAIESSPALAPENLADLLVGEIEGERSLDVSFPDKEQELSLKNLYKLYITYLSNEPGKGISALEARYKVIMGILDQLQMSAECESNTDSQASERLLHRVRGFITAVYCMFREFAVLLSHIVEGKNIDTDTETLALLQKYPLEETKQQILRDITPLMRVYGTHLQLQERQGILASCARDATAFLTFLEECLGQAFIRRGEMISQLKSIINLVNELTCLLAEYEQAMAEIIAV